MKIEIRTRMCSHNMPQQPTNQFADQPKMPNRVAPITKPASAIVSALHTINRQVRLLKVAGWCCIPMFCMGAACLVVASTVDHFRALFRSAIAFYGGEKNLQVLTDKIHAELIIFRNAVTIVNAVARTETIKADVSLLDVIYHAHPRIKSIMQPGTSALLVMSLFNTGIHDSYFDEIWKTYTSMGGNYRVIVYGILEYICMTYEPTCTIAEAYFEKILAANSAARVECLAHKC